MVFVVHKIIKYMDQIQTGNVRVVDSRTQAVIMVVYANNLP